MAATTETLEQLTSSLASWPVYSPETLTGTAAILATQLNIATEKKDTRVPIKNIIQYFLYQLGAYIMNGFVPLTYKLDIDAFQAIAGGSLLAERMREPEPTYAEVHLASFKKIPEFTHHVQPRHPEKIIQNQLQLAYIIEVALNCMAPRHVVFIYEKLYDFFAKNNCGMRIPVGKNCVVCETFIMFVIDLHIKSNPKLFSGLLEKTERSPIHSDYNSLFFKDLASHLNIPVERCTAELCTHCKTFFDEVTHASDTHKFQEDMSTPSIRVPQPK